MSRNQRLSFLGIAAVIAVAAVIVLAGGGGPDQTSEQAASTPTPAGTATASPDEGEDATPEPTATPTPRPQPPLLQAGRERTLRFTEGETVRFRARSDTQEEIHVHGYDRYVDLPPGKTVNVSFPASITGIFEIELHGSGELIAQLRVDPR